MATGEKKKGSEASLTAAYIPLKTFITSVSTFNEGLPPTLDRSAWPSLSNIVKGQVMGAYRFLALVDADGSVQPVLRELVEKKLDTPEGKNVFAGILRERYPKVAELAAQNATPGTFQDALRDFNVTGSTLEKARRFWVDSAKFVGIKYPSTWQKIPRVVSGTPRRRSPKTSGAGDGDSPSGGGGGSNSGGESIQGRTVELHGASVTLHATTTDVLDLMAHPADLQWFQDLMKKFNERSDPEEDA